MQVAVNDVVLMRAETFWARLRGLLFSPALKLNEALLIAPCNSVHTFFMSYPIDVIFIDRNGLILKLVSDLSAWKMTSCFKAHGVIEMYAGGIERLQLREGETVPW